MDEKAFTEQLRRNFSLAIGTPEEKAELRESEIRERNHAAEMDINKKAAERGRFFPQAVIAELRAELLAAEIGRKAFYDDAVELRAERTRAEESMGKMQARIDEQAQTNTALAFDRDCLRHGKAHLEYHLEQEKKRVEMAKVCLDDMPQLSPQVAKHVDAAKSVLEKEDLRRECESCNGPCNVAGDTCLLCGHVQPKDSDMERCPPRDMSGVAEDCNEGRG